MKEQIKKWDEITTGELAAAPAGWIFVVDGDEHVVRLERGAI